MSGEWNTSMSLDKICYALYMYFESNISEFNHFKLNTERKEYIINASHEERFFIFLMASDHWATTSVFQYELKNNFQYLQSSLSSIQSAK